MKPTEWLQFSQYFNPMECGEDMDMRFMIRVMGLRALLKAPMIIHAGAEKTGHAPNSYHGLGRALDFHVPGKDPREVLFLIDTACCFGGCGWYPYWSHPGFHIDDRPRDKYIRWISPEKGDYIYMPL